MTTPKAWLRERGRRIRRQRLTLKLSQRDCAELLRLRRPAFSEIEAGRRDLRLIEAVILANKFGVGIRWLLGDGPQWSGSRHD